MKVVWTNVAIEHLQSIHDYISQNSDVYADRVVDQLLSRSQQIAEFPHSGRIVPEFQDKSIREVFSPPIQGYISDQN